MPTDVTLRLRFDRFLLPDTAIRQSLLLYTGARGNVVPPPSGVRPEMTPRYDVLERTVSYTLPPGVRLQPHALYTLELPVYASQQPYGFRAFDGAPLAGKDALRFSFYTGAGPAGEPPRPPAPSCEDFLALAARCAACHGAADTRPRMGLSLSSASGLSATAIAQPAHQTEIGDSTGTPDEDPLRFGANMPVVDPGRPENSYLVYKLLIGRDAFVPAPAESCPESSVCTPPADAELERLRAWFVRGAPMPLEGPALHYADVRLVVDFIAAGADCPL